MGHAANTHTLKGEPTYALAYIHAFVLPLYEETASERTTRTFSFVSDAIFSESSTSCQTLRLWFSSAIVDIGFEAHCSFTPPLVQRERKRHHVSPNAIVVPLHLAREGEYKPEATLVANITSHHSPGSSSSPTHLASTSLYLSKHLPPHSNRLTTITMKLTIVSVIALTTTTLAGNICVQSYEHVSKFPIPKLMISAAGHICDDKYAARTKLYAKQNYCNKLPVEVTICGAKMKYVKVEKGYEVHKGCHVGLEYNGKVYEGKNGKKPCSGDCGIRTAIDGLVLFEGLPACNL